MNQSSSALLTDLYQLTMLQGYIQQRMEDTAVFEFFVRKLPPRRGFLVVAGLEQALSYLENLRFTPWELDWIAKSGRFSSALVEYLKQFRFTGEGLLRRAGVPYGGPLVHSGARGRDGGVRAFRPGAAGSCRAPPRHLRHGGGGSEGGGARAAPAKAGHHHQRRPVGQREPGRPCAPGEAHS